MWVFPRVERRLFLFCDRSLRKGHLSRLWTFMLGIICHVLKGFVFKEKIYGYYSEQKDANYIVFSSFVVVDYAKDI